MERKSEIEGYSFERIEYFKYFEPLVNENANSHENIKARLITAQQMLLWTINSVQIKVAFMKIKDTTVQSFN